MSDLLAPEAIEQRILFMRGQRVMLDSHWAELYGQLTPKEHESLRFQFGTLKRGQHSKYLPYAFTEQGVAMLASVLRSARAAKANVEIIRAFVRMRRMISSQAALYRRLAELESKYDSQFKEVFDAIKNLMEPPAPRRKRIGFRSE